MRYTTGQLPDRLHLLRLAKLFFEAFAFRDVKDQRMEQIAILHVNRPAIHLHIADFAVGATVTKLEMVALLGAGALHLDLDLLRRQRIDVSNVHAAQGGYIPAVIGAGGGIGVEDIAGCGIDQQHNGVVILKKVAEACLALDQVILSASAFSGVLHRMEDIRLATDIELV